MKKTIRTITLTLAAAAASTVLAFSSGENTVISLSYLNGTFASQLAASLRSSLNVLDHAYEAAIDRLEGSDWAEFIRERLDLHQLIPAVLPLGRGDCHLGGRFRFDVVFRLCNHLRCLG